MLIDNNFKHSNNLVNYSKKVKLLDKKEEMILISRWKKYSDQKAINKILRSYLRLIIALAKKYNHYGLPLEDLVQEGIIGILHALKKFDLTKEFRLSTYASWWIRAYIQDYILRNWSIVKSGSSASQKALFFNLKKLKNKINDPSFEFMGNKELRTISSLLNVKSSDVQNMEARIKSGDQSLNQKVYDNDNVELLSLIKDESPTQDIAFEINNDNKIKKKWLEQALNTLKDREKIIINERKLREKAKTLEELGKDLKISKERVRQIENRALTKLRKNILSISNQTKGFFIN